MVGPVYNKVANGTCSKDASRTTTISEMEFFVIIVNRGALRIFTNIVKFSSYLQVSEKKRRAALYFNTFFDIFKSLSPEMAKCHVSINGLRLAMPSST